MKIRKRYNRNTVIYIYILWPAQYDLILNPFKVLIQDYKLQAHLFRVLELILLSHPLQMPRLLRIIKNMRDFGFDLYGNYGQTNKALSNEPDKKIIAL
jgi:hypothetical protein